MKRCSCWVVVFAFFFAAFAGAARAESQVSAWEGKVTLPTYQLDPGDTNPRIQELDNTLFFPYTFKDEFTTRCVQQDHRAIFLENEYLKITFLPDINGRMHQVVDKTEGKDMFHTNSVIRPARIAINGAWISGGVGWNAGPQGHTPVSYSPLNSAIEKHADGSASVVVTNTRMDTGLRWQVRVTLRPGLALIDEQIRIFNPTDNMHPYYFWNNTSFPNNDDCTRVIWPATLITDHFGTKFWRWPIDKGIDISQLKNYHDTAAMFSRNCIYDFFGAYSSSLDRGIVQYGDHRVLPGKKLWSWGKTDYGRLREAVMGEKETEYIEVQSGPLPTQSDYEFLEPHRQIAWQECWYPVHGFGNGFEYATRDVAIQTERPGSDLKLRVLSTAAYQAASVRVERDGQVLAEQSANLNPKDVFSLTLPGVANGQVRIVVKAGDGKVLADYVSPLQIPYEEIPKMADHPSTSTAEGAWLAAQRLDKASNRVEARRMYEQTLKLDPNHLRAMKALAVLDNESAQYGKALERLSVVLRKEPADGQARYLAAIAELNTGRLEPALRHACEAIRRPETRSLGWDVAGRVYMREGKVNDAVEAFRTATTVDGSDLRARDHLLIALMAAGDAPAVRELADKIMADDPTNLVAWLAEAAMLKARIEKPAIGEADYEALEAAAEFSELGRYGDAEQVITAMCGRKPQNRITLYWLAWLADRQGQPERGDKLLEKAAAATTEGFYASNPIAIAVLTDAINKNPDDARANCDLGNLLAGLGQVEAALPHWKRAVELDPGQAVAWRNIGFYEWKSKQNLDEALKDYAAAAKANPADQTYWRDQMAILMQQRRPADAIALADSMPENGFKKRDDILLLKVRAEVECGNDDEALRILDARWFTIGEFTTESHQLFVRALVDRGKKALDAGRYEAARADFQRALTYPRNLGIGQRWEPAEAQQYYWLGMALQKLGRNDEARKAWETGAGQKVGQSGMGREHPAYRQKCADALKAI